MWELGLITLTSLNVWFADLPTEAYSYGGLSTDVSRFYDQKIPNVRLDGYHKVDDHNYLLLGIGTGTHTDKLNTAAATIGWANVTDVNDNLSWTNTVSADISYSNHEPCYDSFNREYYCGNLTAFSDFERTHDETDINYGIRSTITYRF